MCLRWLEGVLATMRSSHISILRYFVRRPALARCYERTHDRIPQHRFGAALTPHETCGEGRGCSRALSQLTSWHGGAMRAAQAEAVTCSPQPCPSCCRHIGGHNAAKSLCFAALAVGVLHVWRSAALCPWPRYGICGACSERQQLLTQCVCWRRDDCVAVKPQWTARLDGV